MSERILIVEDDDDIAKLLEQTLVHEGYAVQRARDGDEGAALALGQAWDLLLLDLLLPGRSGMELLTLLRDAGQTMPVIILTAIGQPDEVVRGFDHGANDYVTKPFVMKELLARIRNLLQIFRRDRTEDSKPKAIRADHLTIDPETREVRRNGQTIELTPKEFDLLYYLAQNKNKVCSREAILSEIWGYDFAVDTNVVDVYIRYLRQKVDKGRKPKLIQTIRGIGYRLLDPQTISEFETEFGDDCIAEWDEDGEAFH
ncbi:response regulator transcription factor [Paenibacillus sp. CECT 9249]|uniref:response regulator transcription factor n=1 Tax=Paenibacillus sp. CECT 9249 TaxID=2845385 RepID=UPI001E338251|nr:response regulator transcription factor [Paenibacillus sp. CECT 9249]